MLKIQASISKKHTKIPHLVHQMLQLEGHSVRIGFFDGEMHHSGNTIATIAIINDLGLGVPARPFMSVGAKDVLKSTAMRKQYAEVLRSISNKKISARDAYERIGKMSSEQIKQMIDDWTQPPNSPITQRMKGRNDPLVDTGQMRDAVKHKVVKRTKVGKR